MKMRRRTTTTTGKGQGGVRTRLKNNESPLFHFSIELNVLDLTSNLFLSTSQSRLLAMC